MFIDIQSNINSCTIGHQRNGYAKPIEKRIVFITYCN